MGLSEKNGLTDRLEKKRLGVQPIFPMNFAMATLGLKEMGKFLWEVREKGLPCWLYQVSMIANRSNFFLTFLKEFSHFLQT